MKAIQTALRLSVLAAATLFASCQKEALTDSQTSSSTDIGSRSDPSKTRTFYGPPVEIGDGVARTFVTEDAEGMPVSVGINLSREALDNLPANPTQYVLYFSNHAATDFYKHVLLYLNPHGHEPAHVYDVPHFDFHFYSIPSSQRMLIGPNDSTQFANAPAAQYAPPLYLHTPGGVPQMGAHWIDLLSPELSGGTFTKTFIWGSYDGEFIFWEPMITRDYLLTHPNDDIALRQPAAFQHDGWYPQNYVIRYSTSPFLYTIALTNLEYHQGQ